MVSRRGFIKGAVIAVAVVPGVARAGTKVLKGSVSYRERIALPPGATVTVQLLDVSLADAPAMKIAEVVIKPEGQVPVPFEIEYDDVLIKPNNRYVLFAAIREQGRLLFISSTSYPVLTGGADVTDIVVERVTAYEEPPEGRWLAEDILGGGVIDNVETVLVIATGGGISGSGGCNAISGTAKIMGDGIEFGPVATTRKACVPAVGDQEQKFLKALEMAREWRYAPDGDKLTLLDKDGGAVMVLARKV